MSNASSPVAVPSLLLSDLPRVPRPLSLLFAFTVLFGGDSVALMTVMAAVSTVGTVIFSSNTDARSHVADPPRGGGVVVDVEHITNKHGRVVRSVVTARADTGQEVVSHFPDSQLVVKARVAIAGDDEHLVIVGGLLREHGRFDVYLPVIINVVLGALMLLSVLVRLRLLHVLRAGHATTGRVIKRIKRKSHRGSSPQLVFVYTDGAGRQRTHRVNSDRFLEDDAEEPLLCTSFFCALLDTLPGRPRLENGRFVAADADRGIGWAIAGLAALAAYPLLVFIALALPLR